MLKLKEPGQGFLIAHSGTGEPLAEVRVADGVQLEVEIMLSDHSGMICRWGGPEGDENREGLVLHIRRLPPAPVAES